MTWVVVTLRHDDDGGGIVQVVECVSLEQATRLEELRVEALKAPMWTHHIRRTFECAEVPA